MLIKNTERNVTPLFSNALRLMSVALFLSVGLVLLAQSSFAQGNPASQPKAPTQLKFIKIDVGNLSAATTEETLRSAFAEFGEVKSVKIGKDKNNAPIGYVEMEESAAEEAIDQLDESELDGSEIVVRKAEPVKDRPQAPVKPSEKAPQPSPQTEPTQEVTVITDVNFDKEVLRSDKLVIVIFTAQWDPNKIRMSLRITELQEKYYVTGKLKIGTFHVEDSSNEIFFKYGITAVPQMLLFKNGNLVGRLIGVDKAYKDLDDLIKANM